MPQLRVAVRSLVQQEKDLDRPVPMKSSRETFFASLSERTPRNLECLRRFQLSIRRTGLVRPTGASTRSAAPSPIDVSSAFLGGHPRTNLRIAFSRITRFSLRSLSIEKMSLRKAACNALSLIGRSCVRSDAGNQDFVRRQLRNRNCMYGPQRSLCSGWGS